MRSGGGSRRRRPCALLLLLLLPPPPLLPLLLLQSQQRTCTCRKPAHRQRSRSVRERGSLCSVHSLHHPAPPQLAPFQKQERRAAPAHLWLSLSLPSFLPSF